MLLTNCLDNTPLSVEELTKRIYEEFSDETIEKINQINERKIANMKLPKDWNNAPEKTLQNILKAMENKTNNHK